MLVEKFHEETKAIRTKVENHVFELVNRLSKVDKFQSLIDQNKKTIQDIVKHVKNSTKDIHQQATEAK